MLQIQFGLLLKAAMMVAAMLVLWFYWVPQSVVGEILWWLTQAAIALFLAQTLYASALAGAMQLRFRKFF